MNNDKCQTPTPGQEREMEGFKGLIEAHELKHFVGHALTNKDDMSPFKADAMKGKAASKYLEDKGQLPNFELQH